MRKFDKLRDRQSFSPNYCSAVVENAMKPLYFMYQETMSIFLGSRNVVNLLYFWIFLKYAVYDPLEVPPCGPLPLCVSTDVLLTHLANN